MTPKSTIHYWATQAYYHNRGPFAGKIDRVGGRWYYVIEEDEVVKEAISQIKTILQLN